MLLSDQSITAIITCITLGVIGTITLLICMRFNLMAKIMTYCSRPSVTTVVPLNEPIIITEKNNIL
jgi:hypothetical protein